MICKICTTEFVPRHPRNTTYCSNECLKQSKRNYDKIRNKTNAARIEMRRKYALSNRRKQLRKNYISEKLYTKKWAAENPERTRELARIASRRKRATLDGKIMCSLRSRISVMMRRSKTNKNNKTIEYLGCSITQFKKHLKNNFTEGMSFDNYGEWHIDHIKPCSSFDFMKEPEIKKCFNYRNMQPLWAKDNIIKSDKLTMK